MLVKPWLVPSMWYGFDRCSPLLLNIWSQLYYGYIKKIHLVPSRSRFLWDIGLRVSDLFLCLKFLFFAMLYRYHTDFLLSFYPPSTPENFLILLSCSVSRRPLWTASPRAPCPWTSGWIQVVLQFGCGCVPSHSNSWLVLPLPFKSRGKDSFPKLLVLCALLSVARSQTLLTSLMKNLSLKFLKNLSWVCFCFLLKPWQIQGTYILFIIGNLKFKNHKGPPPPPKRKHSLRCGEAPQLPDLRVIIFVSFLSSHMKLGFRVEHLFLRKTHFLLERNSRKQSRAIDKL